MFEDYLGYNTEGSKEARGAESGLCDRRVGETWKQNLRKYVSLKIIEVQVKKSMTSQNNWVLF